MFIHHTIRKFIIGALLAPTAFSFIWLAVFGGTALNLDIFAAAGIGEAVSDNIASALFVTLGNFPISSIMSFLAIILIVAFFITSADSGTFVVAMLTSGEEQEPTRKLKAACLGHPARRGCCSTVGSRWTGCAADGFNRLRFSLYAGYADHVLLFAERLFTG